MKLNRKWLSIGAVSTMAIALTITAVCTRDTKAVKDSKEVAETVVSTEDVTAGIAAAINEIEENTECYTANAVATVQKEEVDVVALAEEAEEAEDASTAFYANWLVADVKGSMNVRAEADEEADLVGKLHKGDLASVVSIDGDWTKIKSGNVEGYVKSEYTLVGEDAYNYVNENCDTVAVVQINGLRIREEMSTDADVVKTLAEGDKVVVDKSAAVGEGWLAVKYNKKTCYVSSEYVKVSLDTGVALTMKEEAEKAAAEKAAAEKAAAEKAAAKSSSKSDSKTSSNQKESAGTTQGTSLAATADDTTLLAAIIQCEAGGQSYDCQLAVGAVVVNRVKSGSYPNNVHDVIFQKSQFGPVSNGALEKRLAKGVSDTAYQAAQAALSGSDNTDGAIGFKLASSGHDGVVIGPIVFFK